MQESPSKTIDIMSDTDHAYEVGLTWKYGRVGQISSPDLKTTIEIATPPEFAGGVPGIWSPEHLFTASIVSCFMTTFLAIAENSKLEFESISVASTGYLGKVDGKFEMTRVVLRPDLVIVDESDTEKADRIMHKAEAACLISRSIKTEVALETKIRLATLNK
jgi:peroxiredoxin-like protein